MLKIFKIIGLIFSILLLQQAAFAQTLKLQYLDEQLSYFPEARRFSAEYEDLTLQGIEVGPEDGVPLIFVGGFTSNLPIYRKLVRELASRGFRVFNYNPPGQGSESLISMGDDPSWQSFEGLVEALELMHRTVYEMTDSKVVVAGHSLGGMQARVFSLGLNGLRTGKLKPSKKKQKEVIEHTSALIPVFSPSLSAMSVRYQGRAYSRLVEDFSEYLMRNTVPRSMEYLSHHRENMPDFLKSYFGFVESFWLAPTDFISKRILRWWTGRDMDLAEMRAVGHLGMSTTIYPEIVDSLSDWNKKGGAISLNGFNMGEAWLEKQNGSMALPTLLAIAEKDSLAPKDELMEEVEQAGVQYLEFRGGHVDPLLDNEQVPVLVDEIIDLLEQPACEIFFKAS